MSDKSKIEWTDATWNPVRGCTKVSPGCAHCYAETFAERFRGVPGHAYEQGFDLRLVPEQLAVPLGWRKPRRVFVNSMSDLFHEQVPFEFIDRVFAVMALCPQHAFQVLTKRPERAAEYLARRTTQAEVRAFMLTQFGRHGVGTPWPLPNVWLGTSVEDQRRADERIPHLLRCPAAVRFLSVEPLLGPVDLTRIAWPGKGGHRVDVLRFGYWDERMGFVNHSDMHDDYGSPIQWVIVGGESGPCARPCALNWIRDIRDQCQAAGVPIFIKQIGSNPTFSDDCDMSRCKSEYNRDRSKWCMTKDKKGGDEAEWPDDLRVREFPVDGLRKK